MAVLFNEGDQLRPQQAIASTQSAMAGWIVRKGLAKNESSANITLIAISIVAFCIGGYLFFFSGTGSSLKISNPVPSGEVNLIKKDTMPQTGPSNIRSNLEMDF